MQFEWLFTFFISYAIYNVWISRVQSGRPELSDDSSKEGAENPTPGRFAANRCPPNAPHTLAYSCNVVTCLWSTETSPFCESPKQRILPLGPSRSSSLLAPFFTEPFCLHVRWVFPFHTWQPCPLPLLTVIGHLSAAGLYICSPLVSF